MSGRTFTVRRGMTPVPNETIYGTFSRLEDANGDPGQLSIQALGLLLLALSRPSGRASQGYRAFQGRGMGRDALLKANRELSAAGLRFQFKRRGPGGSIITDTIISEVPITAAEAEAEWLDNVRRELGGYPSDGPQAAAETAPEAVDNSPADRAPENGATRGDKGSTVRRFTGARSSGASLSRESAKLSSTTYSESGNINAGADEGQHCQPGGAADDAAPGQGVGLHSPQRTALREYLDEQKRAKLSAVLSSATDQKEVAPLRPMTEGGQPGTLPAHLMEAAR